MLISTIVVTFVWQLHFRTKSTEQQMKKFQPTEPELEILQVLWTKQPCSIGAIHEQVSKQRNVGYTTISKQVERMLDKGMLRREKMGKSYVYAAIPNEEDIQQTLSNRLLDTAYKGSAIKLALHALGNSKTSLEELETLQEWLNQQKKQQDDTDNA